MATFEGIGDQSWYLDSGATHYLINLVQNLSDGKVYLGSNSLLVGNRQGLQITHIGYTRLHTSFGYCIHLADILCVPNINKSLISMSKLLPDSNIVVEFTSSCYFFKDKVKGTLMAQGIAEDGLYKLLSYEDSVSSFDT